MGVVWHVAFNACALFAAAGGCHQEAPAAVKLAPTTNREETIGTAARAPAAPMEPQPNAAAALSELMKDHFGQAVQARDAVLRGQLALAEAPLQWLGQQGFAKNLPADWRPHVDRMQAATRQATNLSTLAAAADGIAALASECGDCHRALGRGPHWDPTASSELDDRTAQLGTHAPLQRHMHEQLWGIERMWEGLVIPSDSAWQKGAQSASELRAHSDVAIKLRPRLERVRALGAEARAGADVSTRARIYARILAECGGCHADQGVDPGAVGKREGQPPPKHL